jgi:hypothetical protein
MHKRPSRFQNPGRAEMIFLVHRPLPILGEPNYGCSFHRIRQRYVNQRRYVVHVFSPRGLRVIRQLNAAYSELLPS